MNVCCDCQLCWRRANGVTCSPDCAGWWISAEGHVEECGDCNLFSNPAEAGEHVEDLLREAGHSAAEEGWDLFWPSESFAEIEKDDDADKFVWDDDAWPLAIEKLSRLTGKNVGPR